MPMDMQKSRSLICTFIILFIWYFGVENIVFFLAQHAWMAASIILQIVASWSFMVMYSGCWLVVACSEELGSRGAK